MPLCWWYLKSLGFVRWEVWAVNCWRLGGYSRKVLASAWHIPMLFPRHPLLTITREEYQARWTFKLTKYGHFYNMVWLFCFVLFSAFLKIDAHIANNGWVLSTRFPQNYLQTLLMLISCLAKQTKWQVFILKSQQGKFISMKLYPCDLGRWSQGKENVRNIKETVFRYFSQVTRRVCMPTEGNRKLT